jgi:hypothetical protein
MAPQPVQKVDPATGRISVFAGGQYVDTGNVDPNWHPPAIATAAGTIAAGTAAGTYHAPMTAAEQAAAGLATTHETNASTAALQQLAESQRAAKAGEALTSTGMALTDAQKKAQLAEQSAEFGTTSGLSQAKFDQEKADRAALLASLNTTFGMGGGSGGVPTGGITPETGWPGMPGYSDPYGDPSSPESMAQAAALTSSKERGGERLAASMKGLQGLMAERGISGSGVERQSMRDLVGQNLGFQSDTERAILAGKATRSQALADAASQRRAQIEDRNFAAQQAANAQKIQALLATYGMTY